MTEDTESNPAHRRAQAALPDPAQQCGVHRRLGAFRRDAGLHSRSRRSSRRSTSRPARRPKRPATKGTRYSFRTGTDTYSTRRRRRAVGRREPGQGVDDHLARLRLGPQPLPGAQGCSSRRLGGKVLASDRRAARRQGLRARTSPRSRRTRRCCCSVFFGSLSVAFYTQAKSMGLEKTMKMYSVLGDLEVDRPGRHPGRGRGRLYRREFPAHAEVQGRRVPQGVQSSLIGIDDVYAARSAARASMAKSHAWQAGKTCSRSSRRSRRPAGRRSKDDEGVIEALEGMEMKNSLGHPQGAKLIRKRGPQPASSTATSAAWRTGSSKSSAAFPRTTC